MVIESEKEPTEKQKQMVEFYAIEIDKLLTGLEFALIMSILGTCLARVMFFCGRHKSTTLGLAMLNNLIIEILIILKSKGWK